MTLFTRRTDPFRLLKLSPPLISATRTNISPGEDWMEVGAGLSFDFNGSNLSVYLDYTGQYLREGVEAHSGSLGAQMRF